MSESPGVIINNIPDSVRKNGPSVSLAILGSKTGKEIGARFWRIHPSQPKFMVVFRSREERDLWFKTNILLKDMMNKHKLRISMIRYNRDKDLVIGEDEAKQLGKMKKVHASLGSSFIDQSPETRICDVSRQSTDDILSSKFEDLSKLDISLNLFQDKSSEVGDSSDKAKAVNLPQAVAFEASKVIPPPNMVPGHIPPHKMFDGLEKLDFLPQVTSVAAPSVPEASKETTDHSSSYTIPVFHNYNLRSRSVSPDVSQGSIINHVKYVPQSSLSSTLEKDDVDIEGVNVALVEDSVFDKPPVVPVLPTLLPRHTPDVPASSITSFQFPPPPLRQPKVPRTEMIPVMKSNVLEKMRLSVKKILSENIITKSSSSSLSDLLVESWKPKIDKLEQLYEQTLAFANNETEMEPVELEDVYDYEGGSELSRDQAVRLSHQFLSQAGSMIGDTFQDEFLQFLDDNQKDYRVTLEEVKFILDRNSLDLLTVYKDYSMNPTLNGLKTLVRDKLNLSGSLYFEFSQILMDFFDQKLSYSQLKRPRKPSSLASSSSTSSKDSKIQKLLKDWTRISESINKKDLKKASQLSKDFSFKLSAVVDDSLDHKSQVKTLQESNSKLEAELRSAKDEARDRMKLSQQENKVLRSRNSGLNDEVIDMKAKLERTESRLSYIVKVLDTIAVGDDISQELDINNNDANEDLTKVLRVLHSLKSANQFNNRGKRGPGARKVNLVTEEGRSLFTITNKHDNIYAPDLEKHVGKRVVGIKLPHLLDNKFREFVVVNGYINCPPLGWSDRLYHVVTEDLKTHLGQGCTSTPGQKRIERNDAGPMFPPHVTGPRIFTG